MQSIGKLSAHRVDYYLSCLESSEDEYYLKPGEPRGAWLGRTAGRLGLEGGVDPADFVAVLSGRDPATGAALVPRPDDPRRVTAFDLTFSAPKSVSVAWALGDQRVADWVQLAHDQAVADTISAMEDEVIRARRGHGGATQIRTDGVVAAAFGHRTSRAGDPQLHTHVVVANLTVDAAGMWSAPDGRRVYGWAKTMGYLYQSSLRHHLTDSLGVEWGPVHKGSAEIAAVPAATIDLFSKRRAQIVAELERLGFDSPAAARAATLATRPPKEPAADLDELRGRWQVEAAAAGATPHLSRLEAGRARRPVEFRQLAEQLLSPDGLTQAHSSFDRRDVLRALAEAHPDGASVADLRAQADRLTAERDVVPLAVDTPLAGRRYSTVELLAVESRIVEAARDRRDAGRAVVPVTDLEAALAGRPSLSGEQRGMVARLTRSGDGVDVVVGRAGSGKTYALDAARAAWQSSGHPVIGAALAARAAAELESGAGIPSTTIDRLLIDLERPGPEGAPPAGSVLVVDEAAMVGTRKLARVFDAAERYRAKVVLVGDHRQLPEIDAGGAFAALARQEQAIELVDNHRQRNAWERHALAELRHGSVGKAVAAYDRHGAVVAAPSAEAARDALVGDWWAAREKGGSAAMYALRRHEAADLNRRARAYMAAAGLLGEESITVAGRNFAAGDEVMYLRNDRRLGVRNGVRATVAAVDAADKTLLVREADGTRRTIPGDYLQSGRLDHGYGMTIHKAEGATVGDAFVLASERLYREAGFVALSRDRDSVHLYTVAPQPERAHDIPLTPVQDLTARLQVSHAQQLARDQLAQEPDMGLGL